MSPKIFFYIVLFVLINSNGYGQIWNYNGFSFKKLTIDKAQIKHGGPPKDGIPALDYPEFISIEENTYLNDSDKVIGINYQGEAKAYPIRILNYHEIVNDNIGEFYYSVTYCPLCGSGVTFEAKVSGSILTFGVSGLLYNSDVLLYDRNTESLWSQLEMQAVSGDFSGTDLEIVPTELTTWKQWKSKFSTTKLLSNQTGHVRDYGSSPYGNYNNIEALIFDVDKKDARFRNKEMVVGIEWNGKFKAYPFTELSKANGELIDSFKGKEFIVVYDQKNKTAFVISEGKLFPSVTLFWFAWYAFHPFTKVYKN